MDQATPLPLGSWQNFYVIVGSSAGALTGLQFVVLTLIAQSRAGVSMREIHAFGTPTVVHFCTALIISALITAPWHSIPVFAACLIAYGACGVIYSIATIQHARKAAYQPDLEDWIWYSALPFVAHLGLVAAAVALWPVPNYALAGIAADALLFLIIGIHNAWDTITYSVVRHAGRPTPARED